MKERKRKIHCLGYVEVFLIAVDTIVYEKKILKMD